MKTKITCGCGLYTAETLTEYDMHLAEHVAEDDPDLYTYINDTYTTTMYEEQEIDQQNIERAAETITNGYFPSKGYTIS